MRGKKSKVGFFLVLLLLVNLLVGGASAGVLAADPPQAPADLQAEAVSGTEIKLSWTDRSDDETGFRIERSSAEDGVYLELYNVGANVTEVSDTGLTAESTYWYRIKSFNAAGESAPSNVARGVTLPFPPQEPSGLTAVAVTATQINLRWTVNSTNEKGFIIERKKSTGDFAQIALIPGAGAMVYTDTGLSSGVTYTYRVGAYNDGGISYSNHVSATTGGKPAAPTGLTAIIVAGAQIRLTWEDASGNAAGFKIERRSGSGSFAQIATAPANSTAYLDTGLTAAILYTYRIRAYNDAGDSAYSAEVAVTIETAPAAPSGLAGAVVAGGQLRLTWRDNSSNETGFKIERKIGSGSYSQIATVTQNTTTYTDTGLAANQTYAYQVRAYNANGDSAYSAVAGITMATPAAPNNLEARSLSSTMIGLSWRDNANNETGFRVERKVSGGSFTLIATLAADTTTYIDVGLSAGNTYYYRVRAYNALGESAYSTEVTPRDAIPAAPSGLTGAVVAGGQIQLTWRDNSGNEAGFKIERSTGGSSYTQIAVVAQNATAYTDYGLSTYYNTYYYRVRAYNANGDSAYAAAASVTMGAPAAPGNLEAVTLSSNSIGLSWRDNANNEMGFKIERRNGNGSYAQIAVAGADSTAYTDYGLATHNTYYYRVRAYNALGDSGYCAEAGTATIFLTAPSQLTATTVSRSQINLSWTDNSSGESGFKIERRTSGGSYTQVATVGENVTAYTGTGLADNTTYYFRVRAYSATANSAYSNVVSATTGAVPAAPSLLAANPVSGSQIKLSWKDNSTNESGFKVERKTASGNYNQIATVGANSTTYADTGLAANTTYTYRVRAYNTAGNSPYAAAVSITPGAPAAPAQLTAAAAARDTIMLTWADNASNETGFKIERKITGGSYVQIATVGANTTTYTDKSVAAGNTYLYRVRAYNAAGPSAYAAEARATLAVPEKKIIIISIGKKIFYVNDQRREMDAAPIITVNRTLLPIRHVIEPLGAILDWNEAQRKVTITFEGHEIELWIDRNTARVNGRDKPIDPDNPGIKPIIIPPGRTMLPLRFISEHLGCQVDWDAATRQVKVSYPAP